MDSRNAEKIRRLIDNIEKVIFGKRDVVKLCVTGLLARGHILIEDIPGIGKTTIAQGLARSIACSFTRIQFTSDMLPSDIIGVSVLSPKTSEFEFRQGPIFANVVLADEVNRTPPKTQSALLEAMSECRVSVDGITRPVPQPFMVLATQNPIEQEGTYPLPEAQVDRFFMKCLVGYPAENEEKELLRRYGEIDPSRVDPVVDAAALAGIASLVGSIYVDERLLEYMVGIVRETRNPGNAALRGLIEFGASPRASIALMKAARCMAFLRGRGYVTPDDVKEVGADVLRHRVVLSYEAEASRVTVEDIVKTVFDSVEVP